MGTYMKIDYESVPMQAKSIRDNAEEINTKLLYVYNEIEAMHQYWYGKRYNQLVNNFNNLVPQLNKFLNAIVGDIPYIFEKIANSISTIDIQQSVTTEQKESVQKLSEVPVIEDVGMRYNTKEVENISESIKKTLQEISELMEKIKQTGDQLSIECINSGELKTRFGNMANAFQQVINNIETQFTELMQKDKELMEATEMANNVNKA